MEIRQIKELMAVMQRTGTKKLSIKREGIELELEREDTKNGRIVEPPVNFLEENPLKNEIAMHRANIMFAKGSEVTPMNSTEQPKINDTALPGVHVSSPMVGTFYSSPSPDEPTFVKVGDKVEKDTVVCIIEAMKVMNEVKAGVTGVISEMLVENGHPVEFGTKLFRIS